MIKLLGGVFIGVFFGALAFEVISRRKPELIKSIEDKARETARAAADAFHEGRAQVVGEVD
jgi:hypothetical protein